MIINCFRYLGFTSLYSIKTLSLYEYEARMYAFGLSQMDKEMDMHKMAWINHQATLTKEQGNKVVPVYRNFKQFFDYEKRLREVKEEFEGTGNVPPQMRNLALIARRVNRKEVTHG